MVDFYRICIAIFFAAASLTASSWTPQIKGGNLTGFSSGSASVTANGALSATGQATFSWNEARAMGATMGQYQQARSVSSTIGVRSSANAASKAFALKNFLKANLYTAGALIALEYLSDKYGWFEDDQGNLVYVDATNVTNFEGLTKIHCVGDDCHETFSKLLNSITICRELNDCYYEAITATTGTIRSESIPQIIFQYYRRECSFYFYADLCFLDESYLITSKVTEDMITAADFVDAYMPDFDAKKLFESLDDIVSVEITSQPQAVTYPAVTVTNPDGTVTEELTTVQPVASINPDNSITVNYETESVTNSYENGDLVKSETKVTNVDNSISTLPEAQSQPNLDIPTDCDFMPTVCDFIDWFREPPDFNENDINNNFNSLKPQDVDFTKNRNISFGVAQCPAPKEVVLSFGTFVIDYTLLCELAKLIKYFILASAYIAAIKINLGVVRG